MNSINKSALKENQFFLTKPIFLNKCPMHIIEYNCTKILYQFSNTKKKNKIKLSYK